MGERAYPDDPLRRVAARDEAVDVIVEHWQSFDPKWDPSWPTVARHTLAELTARPELLVRLAVESGAVDVCDLNCSEHYDGKHMNVSYRLEKATDG
jgi:hypothetical protein